MERKTLAHFWVGVFCVRGNMIDPLKSFEGKRITGDMLADVLSWAMVCSEHEIERALENPDFSVLTKTVLRSVKISMLTGEWKQTDKMLERLLGKVTQKVDHTTKGDAIKTDNMPTVTLYLPDNGRKAPEIPKVPEDASKDPTKYDLGI